MYRKSIVISAVAAFAMPCVANAQVSGSYAGFGFGQSNFKNGCPATPAAGCDKKSMGFKYFAGVEFGPIFGAEVGFTNLGDASSGGTSFSAIGGELTGVARWPLSDNLSIYGKAGGHYMAASTSGVRTATDTSTDWTYGLGLKMDIVKNVGARLEWQRYTNIGDAGTTGRTNVDYLGVSLVVKLY